MLEGTQRLKATAGVPVAAFVSAAKKYGAVE
jgi:hypothetical protein